MEIRFLTADDVDEYWRIRLEALESDPEAFSSSVDQHRVLTLDEVRRRLGAEDRDMFVVGAFADGQLVGTAGFHRAKGRKVRHKGRIWGVYVAAGQRGCGVGRKMLEKVLERAASIDGLQQVLLSVTVTQTAAAHLYRSLGFTPFGREPRALQVNGRFIDEEYLMLHLGNGGGQ